MEYETNEKIMKSFMKRVVFYKIITHELLGVIIKKVL